jgi:phosphate transport system substrate-binding protein
MSHQKSSLSALAVLFISSAGVPVVTISIPAVAQSTPNLPLPKTVKDGTVVRINGSSSMMKINDALIKKFEAKFPKSDVKAAYNGTGAALKAVLEGKADLASIGRPLTDAEEAKGLVAVPIARNKIAMFVGKENPLKKSITIEQFAKIFRGQATDLSQLGVGKGKIRLVDRPETSDTRRAFQNYPVFKNAPLKAGANAVTVEEDQTDVVIKELGKDGIGYAIADQVVKNANVRVVPMHDVLPSDPRYPFSQPLMYVYKGEKPNSAVQAFLGYAKKSENQKAVEQARVATAVAPLNPPQNQNPTKTTTNRPNNESTNVANERGAVVNSTQSDNEFPWWILLLLPLLGGILWWVLRKFNDEPTTTVKAPVTPFTPVAAVKTPENRMVLTPRDAKNAYAYWEIPNTVQEDLRREGKRGLKLRLYDATNTDTDLHVPTLVHELNCIEREPDLHVPIPAANRDYFAEIGYHTSDDEWLKVASSPTVRVTNNVNEQTVETSAANTEQLQAASLWGNEEEMPQPTPASASTNNIDIGLAGAVGAAVSGATLFDIINKRQQKTEITSSSNTVNTVDSVDTANILDTVEIEDTFARNLDNGRVVLVQRTENKAYAYWEIPPARKADFIRLGGRKLALRLYDVTDAANITDASDVYLNDLKPVQQYECNQDNDLHIDIPANNRDYVAQVGYIRDDGSWLKVTTSEPVRLSSLALGIENSEPSKLNTNGFAGDNNNDTATVDTSRPANTVENPTKPTSNWIDRITKFGSAIAGGAVAVGSATQVHTLGNKNNQELPIHNGNGNGHRNSAKKQCQIILVPRNSEDAYAYWEVSEDYKQAAREQGGYQFMLRVHDSTNLDIDYQQPHATQEYACDEQEFDKHVRIPVSNHDYIAEVGYYTPDNRWIRIIRSFHVRVSAV